MYEIGFLRISKLKIKIMENIKAKIQGILMNSSQKSVIGWTVEEDDFEAVAEEIVKKCFIHSVSQQRELLDAFCCTLEFDVKHETYEEDINYFLENVKADNCG